MLDVRKDFPMLKQDIIYFDNAATTFKPQCVIDAMSDYYENYSANAHRGDYDISYKVDLAVENTREKVKKLINARFNEEIIFTPGATSGLNDVVNGFFANLLDVNDEVLITQSEHASNVLPWFRLAALNKCQVRNIDLNANYKVTIENVLKAITPNTKVISLAHITNVIGDIRPIKEICKIAHERNIFVVVDASQSIPHMKVDVQDLDCDFLVFAVHKMCGPTGLGILYGKKELLESLDPINLGGGMNESFDSPNEIKLKSLPLRLEAGTQNIAAIIGLSAAIDYLLNIGFDNIYKKEKELKDYLISKLSHLSHIDIINYNSESGIVTFNVKGVFSQDVAYYLNKYNICVRAGNHCAKILKQAIGDTNTVRVSLYFYNTKKEIDDLVELLSDLDKIRKEMI